MTKPSKILQQNQAVGFNTKEIGVELTARGKVWTSTLAETDVAADGNTTVLIDPTASSEPVALAVAFEVSQAGTFEFREGVAVSAAGAPRVFRNRNRLTPTNPATLISAQPTVTDEGDEIFNITTQGGARESGAGVIPVLPLSWILDPSKLYLLRYTNGPVGAADINITVDVIEPADGQ